MGGDHGPDVTIPAMAQALDTYPNVSFLIYGDAAAINSQLSKFKALKKVSTVIDCEMSIAMTAKPSVALRQGRKISGMWRGH